jgi:general secretion pathway protein D
MTLTRRCHLAASLLLSLAVTAAAQVDNTGAPATHEPATLPATAPTTQAAAPTRPFTTTRPATTVSTKVKFTFKDAPIDNILEYLASSFGLIVVKDSGVRVSGRITVMSPTDVTVDEAVVLLDAVLKNQSPPYGVVLTDKVLRVAERSNIKQNAKVYVGNRPEAIPQNDSIRTQVIPLATVDAVRLRQDLSSMFSPEADVSANAASNTLVITDTSARIHRIVEIVAAMDTQLIRQSDLKVFKLKYANAAAAAKLITDIFAADQQQPAIPIQGGRGRGFGGGFGGFQRGGFPGAPNATDPNASRAGKVVASSDDRTNTVVVTAPSETLKAIELVVQQIDSDPTLETEFFVYPLKNASALNLQGVLNGLFGNSSTGVTGSTSRTTNGFQPLGTTTGGFGGSNARGTASALGSNSLTNRNTGGSTGRTTSGFGGSTARTGSTSTGRGNAAADLAGQAFVVAEPDTNSLLVTARTGYADRVKELIKQLDRDVPQVLIKVLVCEVTHTNSSDIGVEYSVLAQRSIPTVNPDGTIGTTRGGTTAGSNVGIEQAIGAAVSTGTAGGLVATVVEQNLAAALRFLATTGKLDVLSRPSILASDNQLASIMVGQLVPIITSSNITSVGNIVNSVTYQQVGIILNVTPHINPDGLVILDVAPTISQLSSQTVTVQAGVNVPVIDQRQAQSRVAIRNGQTIIIGGLMSDQKTETVNKIPLIGDIPWVGELFKHTVASKTKTELLIFLTPQVAQNPDLLPAMSADEKGGTQLVPNAVDPGTFDLHMQGMSRGAAKERPNEHAAPFNVIPNTTPQTQPAPTPSITKPEL